MRGGDATNYITEKKNHAQLQVFAGQPDRVSAGEHAAVSAWRERQAGRPWGHAVLIARDNNRRERLNALTRTELQRDGRLGASVHIGGCEFAVGDRVVARRNDRERAVNNGMRGTVIAVDPAEKEVLVRTDGGVQLRLDAPYVAEHLEHAYVLTAHTIQGGTVEWAGVVGRPEDFTRNWSHTALSRVREPTELFVIDTQTERELDRSEIAPDQTRGLGDERTPLEGLEAAMRCRDDEDLALDRIDAEHSRGPAHVEPADARLPAVARASVIELQAELTQLRARIGHYPEYLVDQLHVACSARTEAQRVADAARARIAELDQPARGVLRRRAADSAEVALERQRLKLAEDQIAASAARGRNLASSVPDRAAWEAERRVLRERAAELDAQLSSRRREHLRVALERPAAYLSTALGALPEKPRSPHLAAGGRAYRGLPLRPRRHRRPRRAWIPAERQARACALAKRPTRPPTRSARPRSPQPPALPPGLRSQEPRRCSVSSKAAVGCGPSRPALSAASVEEQRSRPARLLVVPSGARCTLAETFALSWRCGVLKRFGLTSTNARGGAAH